MPGSLRRAIMIFFSLSFVFQASSRICDAVRAPGPRDNAPRSFRNCPGRHYASRALHAWERGADQSYLAPWRCRTSQRVPLARLFSVRLIKQEGRGKFQPAVVAIVRSAAAIASLFLPESASGNNPPLQIDADTGVVVSIPALLKHPHPLANFFGAKNSALASFPCNASFFRVVRYASQGGGSRIRRRQSTSPYITKRSSR